LTGLRLSRIAFRSALLGSLLVVCLGVNAGEPKVAVETFRGIERTQHGALLVDFAEATLGDQQLIVGRVGNELGENMVFFVPSSGKSLLSRTIGEGGNGPADLLAYWSDGNCDSLIQVKGGGSAYLKTRAQWLAWSVHEVDVIVLSQMTDLEIIGRAALEVHEGLSVFFVEPEDGQEVTSVSKWESDASSPTRPPQLDERWDEILSRYIQTTTKVRQVRDLRATMAR
jgi:hypothetical protein